ncbi:Lrp/AsnC family transcriptional regulator [Vibrio mangrovi]|uniref:Leucine-responsive regulatory protein n=1 Tax=Vibrio mangrovi TaxID=474394 RepID=A0A1Y6J3N3_9VIBR|nr:Lrp/AsnC family transcriptional regulator [Vibrio mangrovi]MDW6005287.1 Lrp/AsnC family transcriptional regulator [Vibrio mangrovi]SMS02913.1 Leucine-responsive regulatory protein [Vibrio mangrovi]
MDKFDQHIIEILRTNARTPVSDIAKAVNLSRSAVTARIKKLEQTQVIVGYRAEISVGTPEDEQPMICAYLALKFDTSSGTHQCADYARSLEDIQGVQWCHGISGETDLILYVAVPTMARLREIRDTIQTYPHLRQLVTHTVINEFFNHLTQKEG